MERKVMVKRGLRTLKKFEALAALDVKRAQLTVEVLTETRSMIADAMVAAELRERRFRASFNPRKAVR